MSRAPVAAPSEPAPPLVVRVAPDELVVRPRIWTTDEVRRDAPAAVERWHVYDVPRSAISSKRRAGAVALAIGPSEPFGRARVVGGLFSRPHRDGIALPLGDAVLYRIDLDGDRRTDLEARRRDCWTTDIESAHAEPCIEIVRREGASWRVIARALQRF